MPLPVLFLLFLAPIADRQAARAGLAVGKVTEADRTQAEEVARVQLTRADGGRVEAHNLGLRNPERH